jgi:hypothetical protein
MTLTDIVDRERRGITRHLKAASTAWVLTGVLMVLAAGAITMAGGRWLALPRVVPFLAWALAIAVAIVAWRRLRARADVESTLARVAKTVEVERELRAGSLRGVLEVQESGVLGRLGAETMASKLQSLGSPTLAPVYRKALVRRVMVGAGAAAVGLLGVVSAAIAAPDGFRAMLHPVAAWRGTLLGAVAIDPAPPSVLRGERITLVVRAPGRTTLQVAQRVTGSSWRASETPVQSDSIVLVLGPLDADVAVYATDGRATSDTVVVKVVDKPFVGDVTIDASFPAYLGRRPETIPLGELVRVPRGTSLAITGHSSTELKRVRLSRAGGDMDLGVQGRRFSGSMVASTSGTWQWNAEGSQGPIADLPPSLELEVLPDSAPQVEIISPSRDSTVEARDSVRVSVLATDDHGLAGVLLRVALVNSRGEIRTSSTRPLGGPSAGQFAGDIVLGMGALQAGDAFKVTAIATDGSPWRQVGQSRELVLRLPSASEQRDVARATADSVVAKALAAANAQRQLNQRTQDAAKARERDQSKEMSFEASEQAKRFANEQRQLADRMQQVQQAAKELEKQLGQAGALDSSLQNRLREAQRLMREALTPELAEKLRKLEQASKDMSPEDSKRALQDLAEQQRQLRDMLDKSVEMLKRAALEGQMETLKDEAKELAQRQRELVDSLRSADQKDEQTAAEKLAKELSEKAKDLQKDVKELQKRLQQEKADAGAERAREAGEKIDESLEKLQEALKQGQQQQQQQGEQGQQGQQGQKQQGQQGQQGQQAQGEQKAGEKQQGEKQQGQQGQQGQTGKGGEQQAQNKTGAGQQGTQKGEQSGSEAAEQAAQSMEQAADELDKARQQQVNEWKKELSGELDRSIQEMLQLAREQEQLERKARGGASPGDLRSQQSALQQGVDKAMQRLQEAGNKSSLLSQRSMRMMSDARRKVEDATAATQRAQNGPQVASAMKESSEGLNQAAASLVRDRERTTTSNSATGFAEMLEQLQQMAKQQQGINSAMQQLMPQQQRQGEAGQQEARELAREQREVANKLEENGDKDNTGRAEEMAREARQIAQQLESGQLDPAVLERQQRLFRKMLDAGRLLEEEEREDTGKREAKPWMGSEVYAPSGANASGKAASRFTAPTWNDLRGLTPEERRLVLEYFKRINAKP